MTAWVNRINAISQPAANSARFLENSAYIQQNKDNLLKILDEGDELDLSIISFIKDDSLSNIAKKIKLKKFASDLRKISYNLNNICKGDVQHLNKKNAKQDRYHRKTFRNLHGQNLPPLLFASRTSVGPQGQPVGSITSVPDEVDKIARDAWDPIFEGNVPDLQATAQCFCY